MVAGSPQALAEPDTVVFEDSQREDLGALNLGSRRELNGHLVSAGGFTWGLLPFGPPFAFAEYDTARMLLGTESDRTSFVLVGLEEGADPLAVKAELGRRVPEALVLTTAEYESLIVSTLLTRTPMGITFGTSTAFGLLIGFLIVSLLMFSAVVDHVREFGTLKALGVSNTDLGVLLVAQAIAFALFGSVLGVVAITRLGEAVRSAEFAMLLPPWLLGSSFAATAVLCTLASGFALARVRKVEPGMVFR
jgi:putative ABC transport system permease protein